jgi:hypothetical protein
LRLTIRRVVIAVLFIAAVLATPPLHRYWLTYVLLVFGIVNLFLDAPGTTVIRGIAAGAAFAVLLSQDRMATLTVTVLLGLIWPPAFMTAWTLARPQKTQEKQTTVEIARARVAVATIIAAVASASLVYRMIERGGLQQTAALFVGIPSILALLVVFAVSPRSATGVACKAVTVGLLVSAVLLGEGVLCVAMSAPLFYLVAIVIAKSAELARSHRERKLFSGLILVGFLPMSLEGVLPITTIGRDETVSQTKVVPGSEENVARAIFQPPRFDRTLPLYLRAGFPRPILTEIEESSTGTQWVIRFRGGEMGITGVEPRTGDLVLILEERRPGYLRWRAFSDTSHVTHFLRWREIIAEWSPAGFGTSQVTWTIRYERSLDPAWYFGPLERYAVRLAADYLIDAVATP